jgi:hypothetical protein
VHNDRNLDRAQAETYQGRTGEHALRGFGNIVGDLACGRLLDWRRLVTSVCLLAFVFMAVAHAGHDIAPVGQKAAISEVAAPQGGAGDNEWAIPDVVCHFCAMAAAEIASAELVLHARGGDRVETQVAALTTRSVPAEFPPPIA